MIPVDSESQKCIGRIPVRNLWLLMLYASDLSRFGSQCKVLLDSDIDDLPDLVAGLLAASVEQRLRRNLTTGYCHRQKSLTRVRGRIDTLRTEAGQLLSKGQVYCRFEELTIDTSRNRTVRAALHFVSRIVKAKELSRRCRNLSSALGNAGVAGVALSRESIVTEKLGRNDLADELMVSLAHLSLNLALPTEDSGSTVFVAPAREEIWVRKLFEKAVLGFCRVELQPQGCRVRGGVQMNWQLSASSAGLREILPGMITDIMLDFPNGRRLVIDTKFASVLSPGQYRASTLKSGYIYQMYAYLRSQEGLAPEWQQAAGLFLHPSINDNRREHATIQDHSITFATVNLSGSAIAVRQELRTIVNGYSTFFSESGVAALPLNCFI